MAKKKKEEEIPVSLKCYIINEANQECILILNDTVFPNVGERLVIRNQNVMTQWRVKQKGIVIDNDNNVVHWDVIVEMIGSPQRVPEEKKKKEKKKEELAN